MNARGVFIQPRVHILSQYTWPDGAPTCVLADGLAEALLADGIDTVFVGGVGRRRPMDRPKPSFHIARLEHFCGRMSNLALLAMEYESLRRAFVRYLRENVKEGDVVVVGSFPPNTTRLHDEIKRRGAVAVYWLQDYYPEYFGAALFYPGFMKRRLVREWDVTLRQWDYVVKAAANLGYDGPNIRIIRNWPIMKFRTLRPPVPKTALYTGNLGYAHSVPHLLEACEKLRNEGYTIRFYADGKGVSKLPSWVEKHPTPKLHEDLERIMLDAEIHLVAADPRFQHSLFPSKLWNALAAGRKVIATGFEGAMADELQVSLKSDFHNFVLTWVRFIKSLL